MTTPARTVLDSMLRKSIGLDPYFFVDENTSNYPPYTIARQVNKLNTAEASPTGNYRVTMAVAGFSEAEIEITLHDNVLTVSGNKANDTEDLYNGWHVVYGGLALRNFNRAFKLGHSVRVEQASLKNGVLQINLTHFEPTKQSPQQIPIMCSN